MAGAQFARRKLSDPYSWQGKNGVGSGKVPLGHFRRNTLIPGKESDTRPEIKPARTTDGRKKGV